MDEAVMKAFDMINDRLYNIERATFKNVEHMKQKAVSKQHLPDYLFDYPFDVNLDNHTYFSYPSEHFYKEHYRVALKFDFKPIVNEFTLYERNKNEVSQMVSSLFEAEKAKDILYTLFEDEKNGNHHNCSFWNIDVGQKHLTDYFNMKLLQSKHAEIRYIVRDDSTYWFVCKTFTNVDEIVRFSKSLLKTFDIKLEDVNSLTILFEETWQLRMMLCLSCKNFLNYSKFLSVVPKEKMRYFVRLLRRVYKRTEKFDSMIWDSCWGDEDGLWDEGLKDYIKYLEDLVEKQ
jgi:hypothetical protein